MQFKRFTFSLLIISALLLSACTAAPKAETAMQDKPQSGEEMVEAENKDSMAEDPHSDAGMSAESGAMDKKDSMTGEDAMGNDAMGDDSMGDDTMDDDSMGDDTMGDDSMGDDAMGDDSMGDNAMMEAPSWFSAELVNARSGESFTIAGYQGKVVLVETLAVWCSSCLRQQKQVKALHDLLGERDDFVSLGLDIDPNEENELLKGYIEQNSFDWVYAVSPAEVSRELGQLYGAQYLNPPSTPMLIIDRHGQVHTLPFGLKSAEDLAAALQPFLEENM